MWGILPLRDDENDASRQGAHENEFHPDSLDTQEP
jgi:hypothetical protein